MKLWWVNQTPGWGVKQINRRGAREVSKREIEGGGTPSLIGVRGDLSRKSDTRLRVPACTLTKRARIRRDGQYGVLVPPQN